MTMRARLTLWYTATLVCVLTVYAVSVYGFAKHGLWDQLDRRMHEDVEAELRVLSRSPPATTRDGRGDEVHGVWIEIWSREGARLYQSPRAAREPLRPFDPAAVADAPHESSTRSVRVGEDRYVRVNDQPGAVGGTDVFVRVVASEDPLRKQLAEMLWTMAFGVPIAVGAAAFGGYHLARRALSPVDRLAVRARAITAERLGDRLPIENPRDEIGRLATVFNDTLARLERSFDQMRRFTADASHELRTPLAAIKAVGEVGLREGQETEAGVGATADREGRAAAAAYREVIGSMLEEVDRVAQLVDTMLLLSRADAGSIPIARVDTDIGALAREVLTHLEVLADEKGQRLTLDIDAADTDLVAPVDPVVLRLALVNLVDNAIRHSPPGSAIAVRVRRDPAGGVAIDVTDTGPGIAPEHHARLFDRFYRVDAARARRDGGTGLGLSIAQWAVAVHDGRIEVASEEGAGSTFTVVLPAERVTRRDEAGDRPRSPTGARAARDGRGADATSASGS